MRYILPKISFVIMTFNDARSLNRCLASIKKQQYPKQKIEIVVIDNGSQDNTLSIAKKYKAKIVMNLKDNMYRSLSLGYHYTTGDFIFQLDQDEELRDKTFILKMIEPITKDQQLAGSFTRYYPNNHMSWITRYLSYHPAQLDPLFEYFSPIIEKFIVQKVNDYFICDYKSKKIPPYTNILFRRTFLIKSPLWNDAYFGDHEILQGIIEAGFTNFAYVPSAGVYHYHAKTLRQLIAKRVRNLKNHYLKVESPYKYSWFDITSIGELAKIIFWLIYANLFFPAAIRGVIRVIKHHDLVFLMEPVVTIAMTDVILFNFLTLPQGRAFIRKSLKKFIS